MALETSINPAENMVLNGEFSNFVDGDQLLQPMRIFAPENMDSECAIVLIENRNSENLNLPEIIFDGNCFQFDRFHNDDIQNGYSPQQNFQCIAEGQDGLAMLEIYNSKSDLDQPEFIDVNELSGIDQFENVQNNDILCISDDDDVVFVGEYKQSNSEDDKNEQKLANKTNKVKNNSSKNDNGVRRNPVRKVRVNSKKLSREHILEEDFALLDASDDEKKKEEKENKAPRKKPLPPTEPLKQWPVNAHERPEYNTETKKIEAFDYTIREIQKKPPTKKPRLETVAITRKSKKKYISRKRKPKIIPAKKNYLSDLKPVINSTTELLKDFFDSCKESKKLTESEETSGGICNFQNRLEVFKNQMILFSLVNELDQSEVVAKLDQSNFNTSDLKE